MRTIIMYVLKGVLFLIAMVSVCVLFGEPSDDVAMADVVSAGVSVSYLNNARAIVEFTKEEDE